MRSHRNFIISLAIFFISIVIVSGYSISTYQPQYTEPVAGFDYTHAIPTGADPLDYPLNHSSSSSFENGKVHLETIYFPDWSTITLVVHIFTVRGIENYVISENSSILSIHDYDLDKTDPPVAGIPNGYRHLLLIELDTDVEIGYFQFDGSIVPDSKFAKVVFLPIITSFAVGFVSFIMLELRTVRQPQREETEDNLKDLEELFFPTLPV